MNIDSHFHIFDKTSTNTGDTRYSINYVADLNLWKKEAEEQGIQGGVIVQPSFLGFDNSLLLRTIDENPGRFKGVASVPFDTTLNDLMIMRKRGVRGLRFNLYGDKDPFSTIEKNRVLIKHLRDADMHLQIHHHDGSLNQLLLNIPKGIKIVIDHFGRPASDNEFIKNPTGIDKHAGLLWVKISGQYRIPNIDHQSIFHYWLEKIGSQRLLWGSDWPHTQHEDTQNFASQVKNLRSLTNDAYLTEKILSQNPLDLYWAD